MFLLLAPLLFLRRVLLAALALLLFVTAPLLAELAEPLVGSSSTGWPLAILIDRLLTGYYPALVWLPVLIVGLIAARSDLSTPLVQFVLVLGGIAAMVHRLRCCGIRAGSERRSASDRDTRRSLAVPEDSPSRSSARFCSRRGRAPTVRRGCSPACPSDRGGWERCR